MLRLHHLLNPGNSAKSLYRRANMYMYSRLVERQLGNVRRHERDRCWCDGELLAFKWHQSYGICAKCGCYVNRRPPLLEDLKSFYSLDHYWGAWMQSKGAPTIEQRTAYDLKDGRVDCWLGLIKQYGPASGQVIEIGCGHAVLLRELHNQGYSCLGVEISEDVSDWVSRQTGLQVIAGAYPQIELPECDLFLAFDVIEHVHDPVSFLRKTYDLLKPGGVAILQQPVVRPEQGYSLEPPLGVDFERMFDDLEHLWIFTNASFRVLAELSGLRILDETSRWRQCHEIVILKKPEKSNG